MTKLQERLEKWLNKDILITLLVTDEKGNNYDTKGKLKEVGDGYFVINELDEGGKNYSKSETIYLMNGILSINLY